MVAATHIALVFEALHHNRSDSHWEARKLLFALHCKPRESTIFEMFNWSCFCWVASEFVATRMKYSEANKDWVGACHPCVEHMK